MGHGLAVRVTGGDVTVLPTHNPDQLLLFQSGDLDAAWTVEPWVSRLESEGGGRVFLEEKDALTTVLVVSTRFRREHPGLAKGAAAAHRALTEWIAANPEEAKTRVRDQMRAITTREVPKELLDRCWARMRFEDAVAREDFEAFVAAAGKAGLLAEAHDVSRLVEVP
jgi:NitT/TauT family transport system substrate-binding protein